MTRKNSAGAWEPSSQQRGMRDMVARAFELEPFVLIGRSRTKSVMPARHAANYVLRRVWPELSYPQIAKLMGGRDHSTTIAACRRAVEIRERDPVYREMTDMLIGIGSELRAAALFESMEEARAKVAAALERMMAEGRILQRDPAPLEIEPESATRPKRKVKPKNRLCADDSDALERHAGSMRLAAALRRARDESAAAQAEAVTG